MNLRLLTIVSMMLLPAISFAQDDGDSTTESVTQEEPKAEGSEKTEGATDSEEGTAGTSEEGDEEEASDEEVLFVSADRPSFSAGPGTIAPGHVQFELGLDAATADDGAVLTFPQLFVRAGVSEYAELRLGVPSYSAGLGLDDPGAGTTEFSMKVGGSVSEQFDLGVLPYVRLLNIDDGSAAIDTSLGFLALASYALTDSFGMFSNVGLGVVPGSTGTNVFELAASLGGSLALSDSFGLYLEAFLTQAEDDPNVGVNAGASYLIVPWFGVDAYAGAGLSGEVSDVFGGVGVSILR